MAEDKASVGKAPTFLEVKIQNHNWVALTDRHGTLWSVDLETGVGRKVKFEEASEKKV